MGFDVLTVEIDSNQPVVFPGQEVRGHVKAIATSSVSCRAISISMKGRAKVQWTESRNKSTRTYKGSEEYARQHLVLWNGSSSNDILQSGNHTFPFMFVLPEHVPSSFEAAHGEVIYDVKVKADIPMGLDHTHKVQFNVHQMYDLNQEDSCLRPLVVQSEETAGCCCFKQGPIEFSISTQRSGYVPGEKIYLSGTIHNHSLAGVKYTEAKIVQRLLLRADYKSREEKTTVQRVYRPGIRPGGKDVWNKVPLTVPAVTPSSLKYCNIIDVEYSIVFLAKIGACKSAKAEREIVIGSVPLRGTLLSNDQPSDTGIRTSYRQPTAPGYGPHGGAGYGPHGGAGYGPHGGAGYGPPGGAGSGPSGVAAYGPPGGVAYGPPGVAGYGPPGGAGYGPPAPGYGPPASPNASAYAFKDSPPPYPESEPPSYTTTKYSTAPQDEDDDEGGFAPRHYEKKYVNF